MSTTLTRGRADELKAAGKCRLDHLSGVDTAFRFTEVEECICTSLSAYIERTVVRRLLTKLVNETDHVSSL